MAKIITPKQQSFIASLARRTGAYQDGEGMTVDMQLYPRLDLDAALEGACTSWEASKIIEALLAAPVKNAPLESTAKPTEKQRSYIQSLLAKAGDTREVDFDAMTVREASALIDELKPLAYAA
ncbi:hypothetical protein CCICO_04505 [Corynebacterium ciconiae DSM 44920]|uniref:hypothetical protein n=1 Tax=Corynebacterium ciconiae TaxID=227319 RepID=UPI0026495F13|nr:hypothetical protein [Corynebacterium ciconiae]WKD60938.1 hypothetical protein CCICO_04505 [Corynebacterium ciconiae DSM 44920]